MGRPDVVTAEWAMPSWPRWELSVATLTAIMGVAAGAAQPPSATEIVRKWLAVHASAPKITVVRYKRWQWSVFKSSGFTRMWNTLKDGGRFERVASVIRC